MTSRRLLDPVQKILLDAADHVEVNGWFRIGSKPYRSDGADPVCALVAIDRCGDICSPFGRQAMERFSRYVGGSTTEWNDQPGRTKDEVVSALREAAIQYQPATV